MLRRESYRSFVIVNDRRLCRLCRCLGSYSSVDEKKKKVMKAGRRSKKKELGEKGDTYNFFKLRCAQGESYRVAHHWIIWVIQGWVADDARQYIKQVKAFIYVRHQ
jgi:hypothetical protein